MRSAVCLLAFMACLAPALNAQTTLAAGDIAFIGYNCREQTFTPSTLPNEFAFVILRTGGISAGTPINFTDNGYKIAVTNALGTTEGIVAWTASTAMAQFSKVFIKTDPNGTAIVTVSAGTAGITGTFLLSQSGDQILAYQGATVSPTFISGIHMNSDNGISTAAGWDNLAAGTTLTSNRSDVPPGLTSGVNCIAPDPSIGTSERDNGIYNCTGATGATIADVRTAINNSANWNIQNDTQYSLPPNCSFSLSTPLAATITGTNVACNGASTGVATASVTGGVTPYNYSWSPSGGTAATASGLGAGTYTVTITDNVSTQITRTITITQPSAMLATTSSTNTSCFGLSNGRTSVTASGGTPGYTYSWTPSGGTAALATGLGANVYSVTVRDGNNCPIVATATVTQPTSLTAVASATAVSCNGGSTGIASVSASGGTPSYFYSWAPSGGTGSTATGLSAGNYTVTTTDNNSCTRTATIAVTQPGAINTSTSTVNASCFGYSNGIVAVSASGGTSPYTYTWSPSGGNSPVAVGMPAGSYTVSLRDANGCPASRVCTITQPSALLASTTQTNATCFTGSDGSANVNVSGGTPGYTYSWSPSGGNNPTATGLSAGVYTVSIEDVRSCPVTATVDITSPSAIVATPSQTNTTCGNNNGIARVSVSGGVPAYTYSWTPSGGTAATATGLAAGNYTVTITDANNCTQTQVYTIAPSTPVSGTVSSTPVSCFGGGNGTATILAGGGTSPYTYTWSPSGGNNATATGLSAGNYTVQVRDASGCPGSYTVSVGTPAALAATTSFTNVACNGGNNGIASISVSGGTTPYGYSWAPSGGTAATATGLTAGNYTVTVTDNNTCQLTRTVAIGQPTALNASTSQTNIACFGGTGVAAVSVTGGTGAYTYSWTPSGGTAATATGLAAGNYTVTVRDANNCLLTRNYSFTAPSAITATASQTAVSCNGGNNGVASVNATGGTGTLSYTWTPSGGNAATATGLIAGTYSVTIKDANNCSITQTVSVSQPVALAGTTTATNVACNGGSNGAANVNVTGGTAPYTYTWTPTGGNAATASAISAGAYTVNVKDNNNCAITRTVQITEPTALSATTSQTNIACNGGTGVANITVTGGTGAYSYTWTPSGGNAATATGLAAGGYTVTARDANNCQIVRTYTFTQPNALVATPASTNVACNGNTTGAASVSVTGGTGAYGYTWTPSGGNAAAATGLASGNYTVTIKDANLCTTTQTFNITQPTVLNGTVSSNSITCNGAANGSATVTATGGTSPYTYTWSPTGGNSPGAGSLTQGNYTVTVRDNNGCVITRTTSIAEPTALSATPTSTNITCGGGTNGTAKVVVAGGTGAYTYTWTPSGGNAATATNLSAGNYTVTIKDANLCTLTQTFALTAPASMSATTTQTNVICNGQNNGVASISVTGGAGSYTYSWTPSGGTAATATNLAPNNYTVTVKDLNNCSIARTYTITQPAVLVSSPSSTAVSCNGGTNGTAVANVSGGTAPYTYTWIPTGGTGANAINLSAGSYTINVSDANHCLTGTVVTVAQPAVLAATSTQTNIGCNGAATGAGSVSVTGGTSPYSYTWTPTGGNTASATGLTAGTYTVWIADSHLCGTSTTLTLTEPAALVSTITNTNASCYGLTNGSAFVTTTGGVGPYNYTWTPGGVTGNYNGSMGAGTYTVHVLDANGCTINPTVTITQPAAIVLTQSLSICQGQSVTVGTSTYTATGTYTNVVAAQNGCDSTITTILTVNALPSLTVTASSATICAGTSATLTATGATTYTWSSGGTTDIEVVSPATSSNYTVTGQDGNMCVSTATIDVTVNPSPVLTPSASANPICNGQPVTLTGGGATTYTWSSGVTDGVAFTPTATAVYTVTATGANGCEGNATITVTVNALPNVTANATSTLVCPNQSVTLTGGGATTYTWSSGVTNGTPFTPTVSATYTVVGTDGNGCQKAATVTLSVSPCTGIDEQTASVGVSVYPNPFSHTATVSISNYNLLSATSKLSLDLYDNTGRLVKHLAITGAQTELMRGELAHGLYFYNIVSDGNILSKGKVIID